MDVHRVADGDVDMTKVVWDGTDEFSRFLKETPGVVVRDVEAALKKEGENIIGVSIERTPVDLGKLWATGHAKLPVTKGGKTTVVLAYGTDYAVYAHEQEPRAGGQGQSKFLESAVKEGMPGMVDRLRLRVLHRIGRRR